MACSSPGAKLALCQAGLVYINMDDDDDFAGRSRLRCALTECNHDAGRCWVVWGGLAFCETATTCCKHCHGRIWDRKLADAV